MAFLPNLAPVRATSTTYDYGTALDIQITPNPAMSEIEIQLPAQSSTTYRIDIFDTQGHTVYSHEDFRAPQGQALRVPVQSWSPGAYYVRITTPKGISMQKMMVVR